LGSEMPIWEFDLIQFQNFSIPNFPNTKNFLFFRTAKVMENLIQQNFEMKFFGQFSTGFAGSGGWVGVTGDLRPEPWGIGREA